MTQNHLRIVIAYTLPSLLLLHPVHAQRIYWTISGEHRIQRADLDGSHIEDLLVMSGAYWPTAIALDLNVGKMYWTDGSGGGIYRANLDGSGFEDVLFYSDELPFGIALDLIRRKVYWTYGSPGGGVRRADLDGTNIETVYVTSNGVDPHAIALDQRAGKMYWTEPFAQIIRRANLDGTKVQTLLSTEYPLLPWAIALDVARGRMYWTVGEANESVPGRIQRSNLDGTNVEDLLSLGQDVAIDMDIDAQGGKIYWVETHKIRRANLDASRVEDIVTPTGVESPSGIALDVPASIPALSVWGAEAMILVLLVAGWAVIRHRSVEKEESDVLSSNVHP